MLYAQAVALEPGWSDGWWFLGYLQYQQDDCDAARPSLTRYLQLNPTAGPALALRGICEFQSGEYAAALPDIHRAIENGGANSKRSEQTLRFHEAQLLTLSSRFEAALQGYVTLGEEDSLAAPMFVGVALAGLRQPLLVSAVPEQQRPALISLGTAASLLMRGNTAAASAAFAAFFDQFPSVPQSHFFHGYLLFTSDPDAAKVEFERELKLSPGNTAAAAMLAWADLQQGRPEPALPYARLAAESEPANPFAQLVDGRSLVETGALSEGLGHLETSQRLDPANLDTHLALATAYSKIGKAAEARAERLRCLDLTASAVEVTPPDPHAAQRSSGQP